MYISELSPHTASSSTSTHFADLMPDKSAGRLFNIELDDNSDSQECVDLVPDKPTGGLFNIELDNNSDSQECVDLMPDKPTGGLFNIELDNSDSQECVDLMPDKPTGGLFNIELDNNSDSQECVDLMPDKPTGGLFNIELDDNSDSLEGLDRNVAFPVSTFVNCANVDNSTDRKMDLHCAPTPSIGDDRLNRHLQNTPPTSFTDCTSPVVLSQETSTAVLSQEASTAVLSKEASTTVLSQEASTTVLSQEASTTVLSQEASTAVLSQEAFTAMFTEGSDNSSEAGKADLHPSCPLETSSSTMSTRGSRSSSLHSECSSIVVHTTSSYNDDESQTSVAGNGGQDTWGTAIIHGGGDTGNLVACGAENVDKNSEVGDRESNRDKHLSKSKFCRQEVVVSKRTPNTDEANILGDSCVAD